MANSGSISVELKLELAAMHAKIREAKAALRQAFPGGTEANQRASAADKETAAIEKGTSAIKRRSSALREMRQATMDAWRAGLAKPNVSFGPAGAAPSNATGYGSSLPGPGSSPWQAPFSGAGGLASRPFGTPPPIPTATTTAAGTSLGSMFSNLWNKSLSPLAQGATKLFAGLAALRVGIGLVSYGLNLVLTPLKMFAQHVMAAAEAARSMYARQLQSGGLPLGMVIRRSMIADALGVGEREVMQYGAAFGRLNEMFRFASSATASTTRDLAATSWEFRALGADLRALGSLIAAELAPALRTLSVGIRSVIETFGGFFAKALGFALKSAVSTSLLIAFGPGVVLAWKKLAGEVQKSGGLDSAPAATVSSRRMPASAWERMGLVVGPGVGPDLQQRIAQYTKQTAEGVNKLVARGIPRGENFMAHPGAAQP